MMGHSDEQEQLAFNAAFCSLVLAQCSKGYYKESENGLPIILSFLALPLLLHPETRQSLPFQITSTMGAFLENRPYVLPGLGERSRVLAPYTKAGIYFGSNNQLLVVDKTLGTLHCGPQAKVTKKFVEFLSVDSAEIFDKAIFVGRWFSQSGSPANIFSLWGVSP
jgi:hypothetical protein